MRGRWSTAGLLRAESKFRRVKGYRQIPQLIASLDLSIMRKSGWFASTAGSEDEPGMREIVHAADADP